MEVNLDFLRKKISICDTKILELLNERFYWVENVAKIKTADKIPFRDYDREKHIINNLIKHNKNLRPEFIEMLYILLFGENEIYIRNKQIDTTPPDEIA